MTYLRLMCALHVAMFLSAGGALAQTGDGEFGVQIQCKVMPAKTAILSTEILQAKCVISRDVGHFYVGVESGYWNVIGEDRWEIDLKEGEQKEIHFAVKLVTSPISTVPERVPLTVRVGTDPFKKAVIGFWGFGTQITILDSQQLTDSALARRNPAWLHDRVYMIQRNRRWNEYLKSNGKKGSVDDYLDFERREDSIRNQAKAIIPDSVSTNRKP